MRKGPLVTKIMTYLNSLTARRRKRYTLQKQKRLTNTAPSIICNNCVSGIMYSDQNLPFYSPTINVLINSENFIRFVNQLEAYLTCVPEQIFPEGISYPVGVLRNGNEEVVLHFLHDSSFEDAKSKWVRRCGRVDLNNLYIVFGWQSVYISPRNRWYQEFKKLKYPNKRMLVRSHLFFDQEVVSFPRFALLGRKRNILSYLNQFSKKRFLDDFDYVSFLNHNRCKEGS